MSYITIAEATEAVELTFPGAKPETKARNWGWEVSARIWHFNVRVSSLSGEVQVKLEETFPSGKKDRTCIRLEGQTIDQMADLNRALAKVFEVLLGLALGLFQFCGKVP